MNATTFDKDTQVASIQPGSSWQPVYETLAPHGVAVAGGRAGTVGVGGFLTGGGNSFYSASHGFGCDQVKNFEVVLADGSIINANSDENPDLWQALKGGSGNFGIVTRLDMFTIPYSDDTTEIYGGVVGYNVEKSSDQVIEELVKFTDNVKSDEDSSTIVFWAYIPSAGGMLVSSALENTKNVKNATAFDGFLSIPHITSNTMRSAPMPEITAELGDDQASGFRLVTSCSIRYSPDTDSLTQQHLVLFGFQE
jgi:hypothetical protein